jgi:predicted metal-dependent phosphoesterase TrpH
LIDLHTHSDASDGSYPPSRLVDEALAIGLEALAITDHDTLAGYEQAAPLALAAGLDLVCAVELSTKLRSRDKPRAKTVHLLGYFLNGPPPEEFGSWLKQIQGNRRNRNRRLVAKLRSLDVDITLAEVEALGRTLTGRPHFAKLLVNKGYVPSIQEAFDVYLDESAKAYVYRREPSFSEGVEKIVAANGLPCLAHPIRLAKRGRAGLEDFARKMVDQGLRGIEVWHSDHSAGDTEQYLAIAQLHDLAVTGGSDFHGEAKPDVQLGTGNNGNLSIPRDVLDRLRDSHRNGR